MAADEHPFDRIVGALRARGATIRQLSPDKVRATCPAHSDARPSLAITRHRNTVLLKCFAGCRTRNVVQALGLRFADLYQGPPTPRARAEIVAVYDYRSRDGELVAQKVRGFPKSFWWRRPDPSARGGFSAGLNGLVPGLYRWPELIGAGVVFLVEGEKAADRLTSLGLVTTCPPSGANTWKTAWSIDLLAAGCRKLVILADHDQSGERQAERVAADLHTLPWNLPKGVKGIRLPGLALGADVVDWLDAGHTCDELRALEASTPLWSPGIEERRRAERRTEQARQRMQKLRARRRGGEETDQITFATRQAEDVLRAVIATLHAANEPRSGRAIKRALHGRYPRRAIERALGLGVDTGGLVAEPGPHGASLYRPPEAPTDIRSVTKLGRSADLPSVMIAGHSVSVPNDGNAGQPTSMASSEQMSVSACPVTPFAVTHCERTSWVVSVKWWKSSARHHQA